ncbi:MAG: hypothetical protein H5T43_01920 [Methanomethylovorans sp.]|jgi:hypothetical protein|nr:hypothetical protein [Methanomethylovorans sp.]
MSPAAYGQREIFGVDFSGAKTACNKIWVSHARVAGTRLSILECYPISKLNSGKLSREQCLNVLFHLIISNKHSIFGMDFPFGIPFQLMKGYNWEELIRNFPMIYPSSDDFRNINRKLSENVEIKRLTDKEVKAPFCVYNIRLYKQTYYGILHIIRPLVLTGAASIIPMQPLSPDVPWIVEICPASTLKKEGIYLPYKGKEKNKKTAREYILNNLEKKALDIPNEILEKALGNTEGDTLDSIIAAYSVFCAIPSLFSITQTGEPYTTEGLTFI